MNTETGNFLKVTVDNKIKAVKGVYTVTFATENGTGIDVNATVSEVASEDNTNEAKTDNMFANNFSLSVDEAKTISADNAMKFANVKAFSKLSGAPVVVTVEDINVIMNQPQGNYLVKVNSANGSSIGVVATITSSGNSGEVTDQLIHHGLS